MQITGKIVGREVSDGGLYAYRVLVDGVVSGQSLQMGQPVVVDVPIDTSVVVTVPDPKSNGQLAFELAAAVIAPNGKDAWSELPGDAKAAWESGATAAVNVAKARASVQTDDQAKSKAKV